MSRDNDPAESHCWHDHEQQAFCVFPHVLHAWELHSNGNETSGKNNSHHLESDLVLFSTTAWDE